MRFPIVLVRSAREPDSATGFIRRFTAYWRGWAKMTLAPQQNLEGENSTPLYTHTFIVRRDVAVSVEISDFVVWENRLMAVRDTQVIGDFQEYLRIRASDHDTLTFPHPEDVLDEQGRPIITGFTPKGDPIRLETADPATPPPIDARNNPFWEA
jgi:hypothetical protein